MTPTASKTITEEERRVETARQLRDRFNGEIGMFDAKRIIRGRNLRDLTNRAESVEDLKQVLLYIIDDKYPADM